MMNPPPLKRSKKNADMKKENSQIENAKRNDRRVGSNQRDLQENKIEKRRSFDDSVLVVSSPRSCPRIRRTSSF